MFSDFMLPTWIAASLVAVVAGVVGLFVVLRGASFAAHALPLSAFPGAAAASLTGVSPLVGMGAFAALAVAGIARPGRRGGRDVATALTLVTLLGAGALLLNLGSGYASELYTLLFGQVLGVGAGDLALLGGLGAAALAGTAALWRPLLLSSVSPELAEAAGVPTRRLELAFLALLALATVLTLPVVGALLVFSLMVGPPAAARALADRPLPALLLSAGIALLVTWLSLASAYITNWPVGFFVGLLGALAYGLGSARAARHARRAAA